MRDRFGIDGGEAGSIPDGATLVNGRQGWFLIAARTTRMLGGALAWARKEQVEELHVLAAEGAGVLTRRAGLLRRPPSVWRIAGRELEPGAPAPYPAELPGPEGIESLEEVLRLAGVEIVCQGGVVSGEVLGLEIARVVSDASGSRLEVGVGRNDREAFAVLHGDLPAAEALAEVVGTVRRHRRPGAPDHPLGRLAPERWLRARLVAEPGLVGMVDLAPVEPLEQPEGVGDRVPAGAVGVDAEGRSAMVVCSVGVDLDLVPHAADLRHREELRTGADLDRLMVVVPERDALPVTEALAAMLDSPAQVVALEGDWRS